MKTLQIIVFSMVLNIVLSNAPAYAWGGRGHATVCEAAIHLVKNQGLQKMLSNKRPNITFLCNVPDIVWKGLSKEIRKDGDSAHYLNPENAGFTLDKIPRNFKEYIGNKPGLQHENVGSLWWRADQLYRLAVQQGPQMPAVDSVNAFIKYIGIMGHFFGDAAMPYHSWSDRDGWAHGHGGIHAFYETDCVNTYAPDLLAKVVRQAQTKKSQENKSVYNLIREVSLETRHDLLPLEKLDATLKKSEGDGEPGGTDIRAERQPLEKACPQFESLIVKEMARAAKALAQAWDKSYVDAGSKDLSKYQSYEYPFQPEFIPPDYLK